MAIVSVRKARLQERAKNGNARAKIALDMANHPETVLSTIQIGITLVGIFAGAFGGSTLVTPLSDTLKTLIPQLGDSTATAMSVALVVGLTTYLSLVIGELVPKQLALQNAEVISLFMARPLQLLSKVVAPLVWTLNISTRTVIRLLGITESAQDIVTEGEIITLIRKGVDVGIFDDAEEDLVRNVMNLDEQRIAGFITPRIDIVTLKLDADNDTIRETLLEHNFTTYPVVADDFDTVKGIVRGKDTVPYLINNEPIPMDDLMLQPLFVPESVNASQLLEKFKLSGIHTAIVVDEYGSHIGLIRLHDIIEQIVGEIDGGEFDTSTDPNIVERTDGSYYLDGLLPLSQVEALFDHFAVPEGESGQYETLAGFIMARLQRIPDVADTFDYEGLHFEVVDMDDKHIDKVMVKLIS
jgi:putative hemolysin